MGGRRFSWPLCPARYCGQALLDVLQPQTTGDGRLFQRKIVGAATMPSRGRGGAPSWPEVRDESLCPGGASPPDIGRKAYCPGKRRPVLRCHDWGRRCRRRGVRCRRGRKEGWKEKWREGNAADSAHGGIERPQTPVTERDDGRTGCRGWKYRRPERFWQGQKQEMPQQRLRHFLRKESSSNGLCKRTDVAVGAFKSRRQKD